MDFQCKICPAKYNKKYNLQRHYKNAHPNIEMPTNVKKRIACPEQMDFPCKICPATYKKKNNLQRHYENAHPNTEMPTNVKKRSAKKIACPMAQCKDLFTRPEELEEHLDLEHGVETGDDIQHFKAFKNKEEFFHWKNDIEKSTNSRYVKRNLSKRWSTGELRQRYHCHRSGKAIVKLEDRQRRLRQQGSAKIGKECPAAMVAIFHEKGVSISYNFEHSGHTLDPEYVPTLERDMIVASASLSDAKICRLCAQPVENAKSLFAEDCADLLQQCNKVLPFELMNDGRHPVLVCEVCEMEMQMICGFIDKVISAQASLQKMMCNRIRRMLRHEKYMRDKRREDLNDQPRRKGRKRIQSRTPHQVDTEDIWPYETKRPCVQPTNVQNAAEQPSFSSNSSGKYFMQCPSQPQCNQPKSKPDKDTSKDNVDKIYVILDDNVFPTEDTPNNEDHSDSLKVLIEAADLVNQRP